MIYTPPPLSFSLRFTRQVTDYQGLQWRGPPASHSLCRAGQSSDLLDPSPVPGDLLKQMQRGRKGGPLPDNPTCTLWSYLLSLGTPPCSRRAAMPQERAGQPDMCERGGIPFSLAVTPGQYSAQGPKANSLEAIPSPWSPSTCAPTGP